jgi:hypothetical protein
MTKKGGPFRANTWPKNIQDHVRAMPKTHMTLNDLAVTMRGMPRDAVIMLTWETVLFELAALGSGLN